MKDKQIIFKCDCGHYGFMEFDYFDNEATFWVSFIEEPRGFWKRLKSLFKSKRYISEIALTKEDAKKLKNYLEEIL